MITAEELRSTAGETAGANPERTFLWAAGRSAARSTRMTERACSRAQLARHTASLRRDLESLARRIPVRDEDARWIFDNLRLLRTAARQAREAARPLARGPAVESDSGVSVPRVCSLMTAYIEAARGRFTETTLQGFLAGYQETIELEMSEVWALKPALQIALLERLISSGSDSWPALISSIRRAGETIWKDFFESVNVVDHVLAGDPPGVYAAMDYDSREQYRDAVTDLARYSPRSEREVAETAVELARAAARSGDGSRAAGRRAHIGYYLAGRGLGRLREAVGYKAPLLLRLRDLLLESPNGYYLVGIELLTFLIVIGLLGALDTFTPVLAGFILLLLPATQSAVEFMNNLTTSLLRPRRLPKLDFSRGVPENCATMVAVPTLLLNEAQVRNLVLDLEIRFLANRDPNLYFALLTDSPDSDQKVDERDALVEVCSELIEGLNRRYGSEGRTPFYLLHRHRIFNPSEGRWMGWERKRGKLLDFNQLVRGGFDSFPVKVGDVSVFPALRYVITLDSDTQLPRGAAAALIGAIAHPLNRAVVDPATRMVVEGYGIIQPRIGISVDSACRSRLASLYSGQTGFDIYTRAISDVYQDLYGEGIFTGKGIYEIDALNQTLHRRFPENALLSHDLIEGAYSRAALASDIELIDDYPSHFSAYSRRKHRWVRGDWQILRWLSEAVPDYHGRLIPNPISLISRWKIFDNLRRSLIEPNILLLLVAGWFYLPGGALYWTAATISLLFMPVYADLLFSLFRAPWLSGGRHAFRAWTKDTAGAFVKGNLMATLGVAFLLHQALLSLDAIVRSILRVFITRRKLLEWETAAEAEAEGARTRKATVDIYLEWTPYFAAALAGVLWFVRPAALPMAAPVLALWFLSRAISAFLNRPPRAGNRHLKPADARTVNDSAEKIWRFFHEWSTPATNWLIPDSVREDGVFEPRISPTNLGLLLNTRIAALHMDVLGLEEFVYQTAQTLERLVQLPKYRGHMLNWYDIATLEPLEPRFVSTVDSGNLAACLWTLKRAALTLAAEPPAHRGLTDELALELTRIAENCHRLVQDMDFSFLYQPRKKVMSVGYNVSEQRLESSCYDLLASESRIASFVAIAKGDIPQESWFHLGRGHTLYRGSRVLVSWTGTMFEYLMPALWMRHFPETITEQSARSVVRAQRDYARRKGVPWGISEAACRGEEGCSDYGYAAFGIPELAMKRPDAKSLVVSPYSTFLALGVDSHAAIENLRRMDEFGWSGRYGFYESADYAGAGAEVIRSWMAHHQGMSLLAACNLLYENPMQRYFHSEPQVMATELLLHERVPSAAAAETEEREPAAAAAAA